MTNSFPHYCVRKGKGYWLPTPTMKLHGFTNVRCGPDGCESRKIALEWEQRWQDARKSIIKKHSIDNNSNGYVYFLEISNRIKIGFSNKPILRLKSLTGSLHDKLNSCLVVRGLRNDEQRLLQRFASYRINGEWLVASKPVKLSMMRCAMAGKVVHDENEKRTEI